MIPPRSPTLLQVLNFSIRSFMEEVHTSMPGRVESYDAEKQLIDVQPMVQQIITHEDGTTEPISFAVIPSVPVIFPSGGGFRMSFPITKGDYVLLCFSERSIEAWKSNGGEVNPRDTRSFNLADAFAIPGLHPNPSAWTGAATDAATIGKDGGPQVVFRESTVELGADAANPPTDWLALASLVKSEIQSVRDDLANFKTSYNSHTHMLSTVTGVTSNAVVGSPSTIIPGGLVGASNPPGSSVGPPPAVGDVKSTIVKAK